MKPFLSIVVPCYNSGQYIERLLQSVVDCDMQDIEVILADDCSPEDYQDHVDKYKDRLYIKRFRMPYNSGNPTNARELGAKNATGLYLAFMDHDDWLLPDGIKQWRQFVEENNYPEYVIGGFMQCDTAGHPEFIKLGCLDFLHGKFFKLDEFYRRCDFHFKPDIFHKEDTWLLAQVNCCCIKYDIEPQFLNFPTYVWHNNEKSLSHKIDAAERNGDTSVTMERMATNMMIEREIYFKYFDEGWMPFKVARTWFIRTLINTYFDVEEHHGCFEALKPELSKYYGEIRSRLNMTTTDILSFAFADSGFIFYDQYDEFMEMHEGLNITEDFPTFLRILDNE